MEFIMQIIMTPFAWVLLTLYNVLFENYGLALIVFALFVKVVLFPLSLKGKKSTIQLSMVSGRQAALQKKYGDDRNKINEEMQKIYAKEGINPMGGCLWPLLPLVILFPLYAVVRQPLHYLMGLDTTAVTAVVEAMEPILGILAPNFAEIQTASSFATVPGALQAARDALAAIGADSSKLFAMNFSMLGIDLSATPQWNVFAESFSWTWNGIGLFLIPVVSAVSGLLSSLIIQKTNKVNAQAAEGQNAPNMKMMLLMGPAMALWIGFTMPAGMGIYWIANNVFMVLQELIAGRILKDDYKKMEIARAEQERLDKEEEKREKAERAARIAEEKKNPSKTKKQPERRDPANEASRVGIRAYARGRAYDPDRFGGMTSYRDPDDPAARDADSGEDEHLPVLTDTAEETPEAVISGAGDSEGVTGETTGGMEDAIAEGNEAVDETSAGAGDDTADEQIEKE